MGNSSILRSPNDIKLHSHGVIEAHAGTGKTYTIVKLVLRMLEEEFAHLRDILLVTYTEKAAGELKKRIQDGIAERIKELRGGGGSTNLNKLLPHLERCLNNMHEAFIGTIHSVCLRLLQTWPFETGVHFDTRIINDEDEITALLRVSMRTDWQDKTTPLPEMIAALEKDNIQIERKHLDLICLTALELLDSNVNEEAGGKLDKPPAGDTPLYAMIFQAAEELSRRYAAHKQENGLFSYSDMLRLMRNAVYTKESALLDRLRRRLRYGIIDEFQDTSVLQWSIFRKIFLDGGANAKFYIVGDPKQSIYAFQGADVESYIDAKNVITSKEHGGEIYHLIENFRSLPEMIEGYNAILCPKSITGRGGDWFTDANISYPSGGSGGETARAPARSEKNCSMPNHKAVQAVTIPASDKFEKWRAMPMAACAAIKELAGKTVMVPKGPGWEPVTLDYKDFAVIIEYHTLAQPFIEEFRKRRIPFMKYKMRGVFTSPMARDLIAALTAIDKRYSRSSKAAALLTHFFNRPPERISPNEDLTPCPKRNCSGGGLCVAHAINDWGDLADRQLWAQLFKSIIERTGIRERLIMLDDGERTLADLRQVSDYCVEYLYQQNSSIGQLTDHLKRLYKEDEEAEGDKNLHTLATEKSCVQILTMHAAKGLEFPIVFLMTRDTPARLKGPGVLRWAGDNGERYFTPYLSASDLKIKSKNSPARQFYDEAQARERRRKLYVAMTRPQVMLFVPVYDLKQLKDKTKEAEADLSPRLRELANPQNNSPYVEYFDRERFPGNNSNAEKADGNKIQLADIPNDISLRDFTTRETSYSQLSKRLKRREQDNSDIPAIDQSDTFNDLEKDDEDHESTIAPQALPGGSSTGNALHRAIEELLDTDDMAAILDDSGALDNIVKKHLLFSGALDRVEADGEREAAVRHGSSLIKTALTAAYKIPDSAPVAIVSIPKRDRLPEIEFLMPFAADAQNHRRTGTATPAKPSDSSESAARRPFRIRGFMDLVFRVRNENHSAHPWRYYFLDWKSDTMESYAEEALNSHCEAQKYNIQAKIYAYALDKYLAGILGSAYSREENLGGSLYVFLRGGGACVTKNLKNYTFNDADIYILYSECFPY
ncbi:MAG: UvrD-helicase domain-containing protein [Chitinispirillia bacterium]|nr:UvrD-helicase domain-containing protein [Chitinispirillia bacterium]